MRPLATNRKASWLAVFVLVLCLGLVLLIGLCRLVVGGVRASGQDAARYAPRFPKTNSQKFARNQMFSDSLVSDPDQTSKLLDS